MEKDTFQATKDQFLNEYSKLFNPYENTKTFTLVLKNRKLTRKLHRWKKTQREDQEANSEGDHNQRSEDQHSEQYYSEIQDRN